MEKELVIVQSVREMGEGERVSGVVYNLEKQFLRDGENGCFIKQEGRDIAEKILFLIRNHENYREMSLAARQTALKYSWESVAEKYLEFVKEIYQNKKKEAK